VSCCRGVACVRATWHVGVGCYTTPDGTSYVGQFKDDQRYRPFPTARESSLSVYTHPCVIAGAGWGPGASTDAMAAWWALGGRHGVGLLKPPHLGTFKVRYIRGKIVEHQGTRTCAPRLPLSLRVP
jgi:hypothetical protein